MTIVVVDCVTPHRRLPDKDADAAIGVRVIMLASLDMGSHSSDDLHRLAM